MSVPEKRNLLKLKEPKDCPVSAMNDSETHDDDDDEEDDDGHSWWASDSGSSTGSYYSDETESSIIEWESEISSTGEIFYIESSPYYHTHDSSNEKVAAASSPAPLLPELRRRASTRAEKLMRLIRRRESKRYNSTRVKKSKNIISSQLGNNSIEHKERNANKEVKFHDCQAGEIREVMLPVDPEKHYKLGRRASLCEAYLGIIPGDFSDKIRVMVAGFIPDSQAIKNKNIKIGDWLRSINSQEITTKNLQHILLEITCPTIIKLELQRVAGIEVTKPIHRISNVPKQTPLVRRLIIHEEESNKNMESLIDYSFGVIYLQISGLSENGPELQGVTYTYPRKSKTSHSILCLARGAFITLNHMLPETIAAKPISTTILVGSEEIHILYSPRFNEELFLMAIPARWSSLEESTAFFSTSIRSLEFTYKSLNNCFNKTEHHSALDHFFYLNFTKLLQQQQQQQPVDDVDKISENSSIKRELVAENGQKCEFESIISSTRMIILPRDAQIQIDAALNEMEAMDYRDWNEDPIDCQRLYTILGSCLYYKSNLLASHLPQDDLIDVHSFLEHNGLANLMEKEPIKSLVIWRNVYPYSCSRNFEKNIETFDDNDDDDYMNSKWFLLLVGFEFEYLAVLFESGGCTVQPHDTAAQGPDVFYVEEAQETLKHIQKIGIPTLAAKWISANARPETIDIKNRNAAAVKISGTISENFLGLAAKTPDNVVISPVKTAYASPTESKKIPATKVVTSILKKPSPEQSPIMSGSVYSLQTSEDSMSQDGGRTGAISEMSDETAPILGRRAARERNLAAAAAAAEDNRQSDDSDSDVDIYRNESTNCSMNLADIRENLLNQAEYIAPTKLTAGNENCLLHYIHLDSLNGVLLSSSSSSSSSGITQNLRRNSQITAIFNEYAHIIRKLLNNAVRFKEILNKDVDKTVINKNLVAVKEHGVSFEYDNLDFWIVGRLYAAPHVKEFYVCYEDTVPQNLVEMAFKLNTIWS